MNDQHQTAEPDRTRLAITALFAAAEQREATGDFSGAVALYRDWIALNPGNPLLHAAYFNYGVALNKAGDRYGAMNALRACLGLKPDFHQAHINLG